VKLGNSGCLPLVGDFNGGTDSDIAVDCGGQWAAMTPKGTYIFQGVKFGNASDLAMSGLR
jgi:hypothetical protein